MGRSSITNNNNPPINSNIFMSNNSPVKTNNTSFHYSTGFMGLEAHRPLAPAGAADTSTPFYPYPLHQVGSRNLPTCQPCSSTHQPFSPMPPPTYAHPAAAPCPFPAEECRSQSQPQCPPSTGEEVEIFFWDGGPSLSNPVQERSSRRRRTTGGSGQGRSHRRARPGRNWSGSFPTTQTTQGDMKCPVHPVHTQLSGASMRGHRHGHGHPGGPLEAGRNYSWFHAQGRMDFFPEGQLQQRTNTSPSLHVRRSQSCQGSPVFHTGASPPAAYPSVGAVLEEVDLLSLESKLRLLGLQRELSAVKCEAFLRELELDRARRA